MNERIQQLAEQAGLKHHNWITNESNVKDGDFKYPRLEDYEKFAELIVQEVIKIAEDTKNYNRTIYTTHDVDRAKALMADLIKSIKQQLN